MGAVTLTPETAIELAMECTCSPMLRLALLAAERAGPDGLADFDKGEVTELLNEGRDRPLGRRTLARTLEKAEREGYLLPRDKRHGGLRVNTDSMRPLGFGVRILQDIDSDKVLVECADCGHRFTALSTRAEDGSVTCSECRIRRRKMEAR